MTKVQSTYHFLLVYQPLIDLIHMEEMIARQHADLVAFREHL